tara:strand:- start:211 stop:537 length:327 start_codon:yes stop_codon:yes gene_type:complete
MKTTVSQYDFTESFRRMGRSDSFSYDGLIALYVYLTGLEDDIGSEMELDVIALCCNYSEYDSFKELQEDYSGIRTMEELEERTTVIPVNETYGGFGYHSIDSFIIEQF